MRLSRLIGRQYEAVALPEGVQLQYYVFLISSRKCTSALDDLVGVHWVVFESLAGPPVTEECLVMTSKCNPPRPIQRSTRPYIPCQRHRDRPR